MKSVSRSFLAAFAALLAGYTNAHAHGLDITSAWAPAGDGGKNGVVHLKIENEAFHAEYLYGASSPVAGKVELHRAVGTEMHRVERIEIPLSDALDMQRSGYHLMLIDLKRPLKEGETVPIRLKFGKKRFQDTRFVVSESPAGPAEMPARHRMHRN